MFEALRRTWAHRRLRRGRCAWCEDPLPDDAAADGFCSDDCERWWNEWQAW